MSSWYGIWYDDGRLDFGWLDDVGGNGRPYHAEYESKEEAQEVAERERKHAPGTVFYPALIDTNQKELFERVRKLAHALRIQRAERELERAKTAAGVHSNMQPDDQIALVDLDDTVAGYSKALREKMRALQAPSEPEFQDRVPTELPHIEARRKLIQRQPGFWRDLEPFALGFEVVKELKDVGFQLHVLTKGPRTTPNAWGEKLEWCTKWLPEATVTVAGDKSLVYGRILVDDWPTYFEKWLQVRPRGLVVCIAHPWNEEYARGSSKEHPNVLRYDGSNPQELRTALAAARDRSPGESLKR